MTILALFEPDFSDTINCSFCGAMALKSWTRCEKCGASPIKDVLED